MAHSTCWNPNNDLTRSNIFRDNRARSDHCATADSHALQNDRVHSDPHVVLNDNGGELVTLQSYRSYRVGESMVGTPDLYSGTNQYIRANGHTAACMYEDSSPNEGSVSDSQTADAIDTNELVDHYPFT